mgnify:CR=1 FL=1
MGICLKAGGDGRTKQSTNQAALCGAPCQEHTQKLGAGVKLT